MLIVLSPAKTLDFSPSTLPQSSQPEFLDQSVMLVRTLRNKSARKLVELMGISPKLATLNRDRFQAFKPPFTFDNAKQSILAFKGDTYRDMELESYNDADFDEAQRHIRILSGLYGVLRPLDLIQPYRLEMGTRLKTRRGKSLYDFWGDRITKKLNVELKQFDEPVLLNLASHEYFKSIKTGKLKARLITPVFKDRKGDVYKMISFFAKRARGAMASFVVRERIQDPDGLQRFAYGGYAYSAENSTPDSPVFLRG